MQEAAAASEYEPAGHDVHEPEAAGEDVPAAQATHDVPPRLYVPAIQVEQPPVIGSDICPVVQRSQAFLAVLDILPAGQAEQKVDPEVGL